MDMSFKLYILSSNGPEVYAVNIYKDDKNKDGYVILGNTNVSLHLLEVLHLRDHVCSIKGVGSSDKKNLKLWKVIGIKIKDIEEKIFLLKKTLFKNFVEKKWNLKNRLVHIFKMNWIIKINLEVPSSPSSPPLVSVSQRFTSRT